MINFKKEPYLSPEGKGGGVGDVGTVRSVAQVLDFGAARDTRTAQRNAEESSNKHRFDTWSRRHPDFVKNRRIPDKITATEEGVTFNTEGGPFFLPYGLGDICLFEDANKKYDVNRLIWILSIFTDLQGSTGYINKQMSNDPVHTFFRDVMQWELGSNIWIPEQVQNGEDEDIRLYRILGLSYGGPTVGGNIPDSGTNFSHTEGEDLVKKPYIIFFPFNGIGIMKAGEITAAHTFPN